MNKIIQNSKQKLQSQTGASLVFAMLLFLACAVLGGAVLIAGTVTSGRRAQLAEMDQKYYSVMSAVNLLQEELDGQTVVIERTSSTAIETVYYMMIDENGEEYEDSDTTITGPSYGSSLTVYKDKSLLSQIDPAAKGLCILGDYAYELVLPNPTLHGAESYESYVNSFGTNSFDPNGYIYTINHSISSSAINSDRLNATITANYQQNGNFTLLVNSNGYKVEMNFVASIDTPDVRSTVDSVSVPNTVIYTDTKQTSITWILAGIQVKK